MIYLERHDPDENLHRFYVLQISRDLFGLWVLTRVWGRAGAKSGQSIITSYKSKTEAAAQLEEVSGEKRKRGYAVRSRG